MCDERTVYCKLFLLNAGFYRYSVPISHLSSFNNLITASIAPHNITVMHSLSRLIALLNFQQVIFMYIIKMPPLVSELVKEN